MMALGTLQYLKEKNITDVQVAAYDALDEVMPMLKDGSLQSTIDQQAANQAYTGVQFAIRALGGEVLPPITLLDVLLVTRENARYNPISLAKSQPGTQPDAGTWPSERYPLDGAGNHLG